MAAADRILGRREYGGVLVIPAKVDLSPVRLLVDTGDSVTALTPQAAERLGMDRIRFTGQRVTFTASGNYVTMPTGRIARLVVGTAELRNVEVGIVNLPHRANIDGLLGVNVLSHFRVTFEWRSATLVLRAEPSR